MDSLEARSSISRIFNKWWQGVEYINSENKKHYYEALRSLRYKPSKRYTRKYHSATERSSELLFEIKILS